MALSTYKKLYSCPMKKEIEIKSETPNLTIVEKAIDDVSLELDLSDEVYGNILVATLEATNNAIVHGNGNDPTKKVHVNIENVDKQLLVRIKDQGPGFDHSTVPDPTAPENLEKINGRGIFLMQRLSDDIVFSDEGRIVELKFNI